MTDRDEIALCPCPEIEGVVLLVGTSGKKERVLQVVAIETLSMFKKKSLESDIRKSVRTGFFNLLCDIGPISVVTEIMNVNGFQYS